MDLFQFEIIENLNTIIKNQKPDLGYVQNTISRLLTNPAVSRLYNDKRVITYIIGSNRCADL